VSIFNINIRGILTCDTGMRQRKLVRIGQIRVLGQFPGDIPPTRIPAH